jgi:hypothetical protein
MATLLRTLIDQQGWQDYATFAHHYRQAAKSLARETQEPSLAKLSLSESTFERWYYGRVTPQNDARRVLAYMFNRPITQLLAEATVAVSAALPAAAPAEVSALYTELSTDPRAELYRMGRNAAMAARRAIEFAMGAERNEVGAETLGHIQDEVRRIAEIYIRVPLAHILDDLTRLQDTTFRLLESGRAKPSQVRDLYLLAALESGMLAKASHDLGDPQSAMMQARTAAVCAEQAEHAAGPRTGPVQGQPIRNFRDQSPVRPLGRLREGTCMRGAAGRRCKAKCLRHCGQRLLVPASLQVRDERGREPSLTVSELVEVQVAPEVEFQKHRTGRCEGDVPGLRPDTGKKARRQSALFDDLIPAGDPHSRQFRARIGVRFDFTLFLASPPDDAADGPGRQVHCAEHVAFAPEIVGDTGSPRNLDDGALGRRAFLAPEQKHPDRRGRRPERLGEVRGGLQHPLEEIAGFGHGLDEPDNIRDVGPAFALYGNSLSLDFEEMQCAHAVHAVDRLGEERVDGRVGQKPAQIVSIPKGCSESAPPIRGKAGECFGTRQSRSLQERIEHQLVMAGGEPTRVVAGIMHLGLRALPDEQETLVRVGGLFIEPVIEEFAGRQPGHADVPPDRRALRP